MNEALLSTITADGCRVTGRVGVDVSLSRSARDKVCKLEVPLLIAPTGVVILVTAVKGTDLIVETDD